METTSTPTTPSAKTTTTSEPKLPNPRVKILFGIILSIGAIAILGFGAWWFYMFGTAELSAKCDNGYTVWRRNPGAWSSYVYEIRNGITILKSNLRTRTIRDALGETHCIFIGGG